MRNFLAITVLISTILICFTNVVGQSKLVQLKQDLENSTSSNDSVDILNELAWVQRKQPNSREGLHYAEMALEMARSTNYTKGMADAYNRQGTIYRYLDRPDRALTNLQNALLKRQQIKDSMGVVNVYLNIGNVHRTIGLPDSTILAFLRGIDILQQISPTTEKVIVLHSKLVHNIGKVHKDLGQFEKAIEKYLEAKKLREKLEGKNRKELIASFIDIGVVHEKLDNYAFALENYQKGLALCEEFGTKSNKATLLNNLGNVYTDLKDYENALDSYTKSLEIKKDLGDSSRLAYTYHNLGGIHLHLGNDEEALRFYNLGLEIRQQQEDTWGVARTKSNIGSVLLKKHRYKDALNLFREILPAFEAYGDQTLLQDIYQHIADAYIGQKDYIQASTFLQKKSASRDSLEKSYKQATDVHLVTIQKERAEQKLKLVQQENKLINRKIQLIITLTLAGVIAGLLTLLYYRQRAKRREEENNRIKAEARQKEEAAKRKEAEQQVKINKLQVDDLIKNQALYRTTAILEGQELERQRVAKQLHDRVGSMLTTVKLFFTAIGNKIHSIREESADQYSKANNLLDEALEEVRRISHDMESGQLEEYGLAKQLEYFANDINASQQVKINLNTYGLEERLGLKTEGKIYQIVQELVSNALKHAEANELTVQLNRHNGSINIMVEDDGKGFDLNSAMESKDSGMGLRTLRSRIEEEGGHFDVDSTKGKGTTVIVDLPLD